MKFGLSQNTIDQINFVFSKYPQIQNAILYGSRAEGNYREGSDIDVVLKGKELSLELLNKIRCDLDDLLTPYKFDISIFEDIDDPDLINHINRVGVNFK